MSIPAHLAEEVHRAWERGSTPQRATTTPPAPGDIVVLEHTQAYDVEWAILADGSAQVDTASPPLPGHLLVIAADGHPLVGSADIEIPATAPGGPLALRCRHGGWAEAALFSEALQTASLAPETVELALERHRALERGRHAGSLLAREVDDDLEYRDWIEETVKPAWQKLASWHEQAERLAAPTSITQASPERQTPTSTPRPSEHRGPRTSRRSRRAVSSLAIAASLLLAIGSGFIWRQHRAMQDLRTEIQLTEQRLRNKYQSEIEAMEAQWTRGAAKARSQLEELASQLENATNEAVVKNFVTLALSAPANRRSAGEELLRVPPGASHVVLFVTLEEPVSDGRYRVELYNQASSQPMLRITDLREDLQEFRIGLPASLLAPGRYRLKVFKEDSQEALADYPLQVQR